MATPTEGPDGTGYELLDAGVRRRLERFGALTVDRPAPGAEGFRLAPAAWAGADLRFDPGVGWSGRAWRDAPEAVSPWPVLMNGLTMEVRPTSSGGLGLYPEHAANLAWLEAQVRGGPADRRSEVLNLFAHTGLATLALARAGASVVHVDGARSAVAWARRNAELSGLAELPVRWIVDDALGFVGREARRGRRYDGIVLDPPAFGRASGREWRLETDLPELLGACRGIAAPGAFLLLTAHSETVDGRRLAELVSGPFGRTSRGGVSRTAAMSTVPLELTATSGARLKLGWAVRLDGPRQESRPDSATSTAGGS